MLLPIGSWRERLSRLATVFFCLAFAAAVAATVAREVRVLCLDQPGMPQSGPGAQTSWITLSTRTTVGQTMRVHSDGFNEITVRARAINSDATGEVVFQLTDVCELSRERAVFRTSRPVAEVTASERFRLSFADVARSAGHRYRLSITVMEFVPTRGVQLLMNDADVLRRESFSVNGQEHKGELVFETSARTGTLFRATQAAVQRVSVLLGATWFLIAVLVSYHIGLLSLLFVMLKF